MPRRPATKDTTANWIRHVQKEANLEISIPHSLRSAGTSEASKSPPIDTMPGDCHRSPSLEITMIYLL